jgi:hypothetical protein
MGLRELFHNLMDKSWVVPPPPPQVEVMEPPTVAVPTTYWQPPEAGDILLAGTNGDVLVADNSDGYRWVTLFSEGLPGDKYVCPWCGGYTFDDYLGHCAACGGPRDKPIDKQKMEIPQHFSMTYASTSTYEYGDYPVCSTREPFRFR